MGSTVRYGFQSVNERLLASRAKTDRRESAMLIVCPNCATSYRVSPESIGETGRSVRCKTCHNVWYEPPRQLATESAQAAVNDALDPTLIRPPLDDVVHVGIGRPGSSGSETDIPDADFPVDPAAGTGPYDVAPSIVPPDGPAYDRPRIGTPTNVERAAAARAGQRRARRRLVLSRHALPAAICALVLVLFCLVAARQQMVRLLPQTASLYAAIGLPVNLRGLAFENIKTLRDVQDGIPMLVIEGEIVGTTARHTEVPRLRFAVVDVSGKEIYAWTVRPSRTLLPPGETLPFRARLASPPAEANGISVRFFNRRDAQAGFM
jgi:predicted Zn finger-like uncharacterized protein